MNKVNVWARKVKHPQLLILLESTAYQQEFDYASKLFFFLIKYTFLFSNNDKTQKNCTLKTNHFLVSQGNGENGARYLDPKYSRWLSTDPALGEYVPQAPINDEAKKHNQNLPGLGGVFNPVNLNLYHYAANNPIRYIDPNGREDNKSQYTLEEVYFFGYGTIDTKFDGYGFSFDKIVFGDSFQIDKEIKNLKIQKYDQYNGGRTTVTKDTRIFLSMSNLENTVEDIELIQNLKGTIYFSDQRAPDQYLNKQRSIYFYYVSEKYYFYIDEESGKQYLLDKNHKVVAENE